MCEPVSITTALMIASTAVTAGGAIYSGVAQKREADYSAAVARNNATLEQQQAADAIERGNAEEAKHWRQVAALRSEQVAAFAANGIDTSFGSAVDLVADTDLMGSQDAQAIRENTQREARGFQISAQNLRSEASAQKRAGNQALIAAGISATGTILSGAAQVRGQTPLKTASQRAGSGTSLGTTPSYAKGGVY